MSTKILMRLESVGGAALGVVLSVSILVSVFLIVPDNLREPEGPTRVLSIVALLLICTLEPLYIFLLVASIARSGLESLGATMALRHPRVPLVLRPVVSLYWLMHFLFAWAFVWMVQRTEHEANALMAATLAMLVFALSYLAYGYLLLAVAVFSKNHVVTGFLLKGRVYCCVLISLLSVLVPYVLPVTYER